MKNENDIGPFNLPKQDRADVGGSSRRTRQHDKDGVRR